MAKGRKTGGRTAGVPNKLTTDLKAMILGALDDAGGQEYLAQQATQSPGAFLTLVGKVLPTTLSGPGGETLRVIHEIHTGVPRRGRDDTPD